MGFGLKWGDWGTLLCHAGFGIIFVRGFGTVSWKGLALSNVGNVTILIGGIVTIGPEGRFLFGWGLRLGRPLIFGALGQNESTTYAIGRLFKQFVGICVRGQA